MCTPQVIAWLQSHKKTEHWGRNPDLVCIIQPWKKAQIFSLRLWQDYREIMNPIVLCKPYPTKMVKSYTRSWSRVSASFLYIVIVHHEPECQIMARNVTYFRSFLGIWLDLWICHMFFIITNGVIYTTPKSILILSCNMYPERARAIISALRRQYMAFTAPQWQVLQNYDLIVWCSSML